MEGYIFSELSGGGKDEVFFVDFSVLQGAVVVVLSVLLACHVLDWRFCAFVIGTPLSGWPELSFRDVGHCPSEPLLNLSGIAVLKQRFWHILIKQVDLLYRIVF